MERDLFFLGQFGAFPVPSPAPTQPGTSPRRVSRPRGPDPRPLPMAGAARHGPPWGGEPGARPARVPLLGSTTPVQGAARLRASSACGGCRAWQALRDAHTCVRIYISIYKYTYIAMNIYMLACINMDIYKYFLHSSCFRPVWQPSPMSPLLGSRCGAEPMFFRRLLKALQGHREASNCGSPGQATRGTVAPAHPVPSFRPRVPRAASAGLCRELSPAQD